MKACKLVSKQQIISFLNKIDYTTKEGRETWGKALDKYDEYMIKFDNVMNKIDESFGKIDGKRSKSVLDNPLG